MLTLGIESTCDETACSVVQDGKLILSNVVSSQIDLHRQFGGVVPELASRQHIDLMMPIVHEALQKANVTLTEIDLIAVAKGPGLIGPLLIGLNVAKTLALATNKPFIGVNHIEAHLYAALMSQPVFPNFPCLGIVLSGGHTALVYMHEVGYYELIGQTVDDAIGEAFDKVAKMLGLPYPGGPQIENLAKKGNPHRHLFKPGKVKERPLDFSFSGLKTAVLYTIQGQNAQKSDRILTEIEAADIAASFQEVALKDIVAKALLATKQHGLKTIILGGGVTNNRRLRELFKLADPEINVLWPSVDLTLDNAAMIAGLGYHQYRRQLKGDSFDVEPAVRIPFKIRA